MIKEKIIKPTVADMVKLLLTMPQDARLRIEDPDTGWIIAHIEYWQDKGAVWLSGSYNDMGEGGYDD